MRHARGLDHEAVAGVLRGGTDDGQGRAQLVAHRGHELELAPGQTALAPRGHDDEGRAAREEEEHPARHRRAAPLGRGHGRVDRARAVREGDGPGRACVRAARAGDAEREHLLESAVRRLPGRRSAAGMVRRQVREDRGVDVVETDAERARRRVRARLRPGSGGIAAPDDTARAVAGRGRADRDVVLEAIVAGRVFPREVGKDVPPAPDDRCGSRTMSSAAGRCGTRTRGDPDHPARADR